MPIPNAVSTRLETALDAVDANTDIDLLNSLIDVGQRSGVDITVATTELNRRANLVDSNTPEIEAAKIAAGLFKVDYPVTDLWTASGGAGGATEVGQLVSGYFAGNPKYVPANGGRYLLSAYPDMTALVTAGAVNGMYEPVAINPLLMNGKMDSGTYKEQFVYVDGDVVIVPQQPHATNTQGYLLLISQDAGQTWGACLPKVMMTSTTAMPEASQNNLTNAHALSVCKLDQPGSYGVILATTTTSGGIYYVYTTDYGVTWRGWAMIQSSISIASARHSLYYRNGALLWIGPSAAKYSIDGGGTWVSLTDAQVTGGSSLSLYHTVSDDGYIVQTNNTTGISYLQWPATTSGWSAGIAFTTVASKLPAARQLIKKCGLYWIAFGTSSGIIYYSTSLLGTYASRSLTGQNGVRDIEFVNGNFYLIANSATTGWNIYSTSTMESAGGASIISQTAHPEFGNGTTALRWPLTSTMFQINLSASPTYVYYRHGRESIARTTSPSFGTTQVFGTTPVLFPHFCRKYGMWFCSVYPIEQYPTVPSMASIDLGASVLHYRSTDGKNWFGIGTGRSGIVDAGSRLLRLNGSGLLEQSTDGITWNTTGVTRPTTGTVFAARLWRCKDVIYYYTSNSTTSSSSSNFYASTDGGSTWTAVSGPVASASGMVAFTKGSMSYFNGKYYCIVAYQSGTPTAVDRTVADYCQICESSNGVSFTSVYGANRTAGNYQPNRCGFILSGATMYALPGFINSNTQESPLVTGDGRNYTVASNASVVTGTQASGSVWDFDYSNGDLRTMRDRTLTIGAYTTTVLDVYKASVLETTIAHASGSSSAQITGVSGAEGHLMAASSWANYVYAPESAAFIVPTPNYGTSPMPSPYMRVAN